MIVMLLAACKNGTSPAPDAAPTADAAPAVPMAVAVAGDYAAGHPGIMSTVVLPTRAVIQNDAPQGAVGDDPVVRQFGGELFVVNRADGNNVTILDAHTRALVEQIGTGAGTNPQDVAVVGNKLYVPALGTAGVLVLTRGSTTVSTIDLATPLGGVNGKPDCVSAYAVGTTVYVACGLLDANFTPTGPGKVALIDSTTDTYKSYATLPDTNPQGFFVQSPTDSIFGGDLLISTEPSFSDFSTGCIDRVSTGATPTTGCAISNHALGGFATRMDTQTVNAAETLWIAVGTLDANFMNPTGKLIAYDLKAGAVASAPISSSSELIVDLAACPDGTVVASDQKMNAVGLRVYSPTAELTTAPLAIGLTPGFGDNIACY